MDAKTAVDRVGRGKQRDINARFKAMASHYVFEPEFCNPAAGWEKGQVEKNVQDARNRMWQIMPVFKDLDELNQWLEDRCIALWAETQHRDLPGTIADVWDAEKPMLMALPPAFDGFVEHSKRVSPTCLITFERNRYSVPASFANRRISLHVYPERLVIVAEGHTVCTHERLIDRSHRKPGRVVYDWRHYLAVIQRKPGALRNGAPFIEMPEAFRNLQGHMHRREGGDREMVDILSLVLASQGYVVRVLNLMNPGASETYNPLAGATTPQDLAELAKTLVKSANGRGAGQSASDPFWEQAAEKLIRIMAQCLINQPDPAFRNLANLRHLIAGFDAHIAPKGQLGKIDQFVLGATQSDPVTFSAYQAFVHGNLKTIQSILMTADVALDPIATPEMAALTATNSIDFDELRQRPTALFIMVNQTQMDLYAFLLNLFYADLFKSLLKDHQNAGRPVWLFLDEFGHLQIPGFEVFATTARKYKVSYALFLQSLAQLEGRYGRHNARTIVEGLGTEIYLPGTSLDTARELEARLGRIDKAPLMAVNDIIRMKENEALMLYSNRLPVLLKTKRYYQRGDLRRRSKRVVAPLPQNPSVQPRLIQL